MCAKSLAGVAFMLSLKILIERPARTSTSILSKIQELADAEREALGFLPARAFEDAIERGRILIAIAKEGGNKKFAGYLLYSGVFPSAKIQQISVVGKFRRYGVASALIGTLVSELESVGFQSIQADVASDLKEALAFYGRNGFEVAFTRAGGQSRGRTIIIHSRQLDTDNLFSVANSQPAAPLVPLARLAGARDVPIFAFDLNVYLDLVKNRYHSDFARQLFGEALGHTIRLAVSNEFVVELRRTSHKPSVDPVLQMALQLPRLPAPDSADLERIAAQIYEVVFVQRNSKGRDTEQAKSDARHIAHAAIARAAAFITRDGAILSARSELLAKFGVDVVTVEEVIDLLPEPHVNNSVQLHGDGFHVELVDVSEIRQYLRDAGVNVSAVYELLEKARIPAFAHCEAIRCDGKIVGIGVVQASRGVDPVAKMMVHVQHGYQEAGLFADYLLSRLVEICSKNCPIVIELIRFAGQTSVNKLATARGFQRVGASPSFSKIALGRPCTQASWPAMAQKIRRCTGVVLPESLNYADGGRGIEVTSADGIKLRLDITTIENLLSPTLLIWPGRGGVIAPIMRAYADDLLGTSLQAKFDFIVSRPAAFLSQRGYVNSPRAAKKMTVGSPIVFYESKRTSGGRGAAVAVARIVNSVVVSKSHLNTKKDDRLVIDSPDEFSATEDVLLTTFDNLMIFPSPVSLGALRRLGVIDGANLVSAAPVSNVQLSEILSAGWKNVRD